MSSDVKKTLSIMFNVLMTAAAVKAALTTISRPMGGKPALPRSARVRGSALGPVSVEGLDDDELDYEDLQ